MLFSPAPAGLLLLTFAEKASLRLSYLPPPPPSPLLSVVAVAEASLINGVLALLTVIVMPLDPPHPTLPTRCVVDSGVPPPLPFSIGDTSGVPGSTPFGRKRTKATLISGEEEDGSVGLGNAFDATY